MAYAISLSANNRSADRVRQLWHDFGLLEDEPTMSRLNYPPHITFAVWDDIKANEVGDIVQSVFRERACVHLTFDRLCYFDADPLVVWAAPSCSNDLVALHGEIHRHLEPESCREHYRPGNWVPHCTLAMEVAAANRQQAIELTSHQLVPIEVVFDAADLVSFPPVDLKVRLRLKKF